MRSNADKTWYTGVMILLLLTFSLGCRTLKHKCRECPTFSKTEMTSHGPSCKSNN